MTHRNLEYAPETPAEKLPLAAIVDILDRGDLGDWKPLATAVARDPYGPLAERVDRLVDAHPMYGTSPLWRAWIDRCRARAEGRRQRETYGPLELAAIRRRAGLTQVGQCAPTRDVRAATRAVPSMCPVRMRISRRPRPRPVNTSLMKGW